MFTKSKVAVFAISIMFVYLVFNLSGWDRKDMLAFDESGYYLYLPATFIYHDLGNVNFDSVITAKYNLSFGSQWYGVYKQPSTGRKLDKYAVGTCIFELPFFLIANWYCSQSNHHPADGYSEPYRRYIVFATVFWALAGLIVLRKFLLRYFTESVVSVTLLLLAFGTNLYFYSVLESGMSHPFSFALFCFMLYATERWYDTERKVFALLLGIILGMVLITRPTNIVIVLIPLFWKYKDGSLGSKLSFYKQQVLPIVFGSLAFVAVTMIQCSYWKFVTGHWIHYSYEGEGFNFLSPEVRNGLFSYRKGWFVYTPVAFIGVIGLITLFKTHKWLAVVLTAYLGITIYIVFSWLVWFYGGSFGCRALIEDLAIVAIPLASFIQWLFARKKIFLNSLALAVFAFLIWLNLFQSYQLKNYKTPWDGTNKAFYWRSFGKFNTTEEDQKLLRQ